MIDKNILKEERLSLPVEYNDGVCKDAITSKLEAFISVLNQYAVDETLIRMTEVFRDKLCNMFKEYYLGHQNKAYCAFKEALSGQLNGMDMVTTIIPKESLYRARKNEKNNDYKNEEMFHINYKMRGKVQTQRFSFPGLPCLYLGSSSYVCWLELNRPSFDQFQVATIRQKNQDEDFKVIDLCIHPLAFYDELVLRENGKYSEHASLNLREYLQWWPIVAACSIAVKNEDDSFKPEYIFPQYMLQYLLEEMENKNCVGIRYISIKAGKISKKQYESDYRTYTNYVIPIRTYNNSGFCETLEKEFEIARNYSGRELQVLTDSIRESGIEWEEKGEEKEQHPLDNAKLYGTNDIAYLYLKTIFRRIETVLENEDLDKYSDDGKMIISPISIDTIDQLF